MIRVAVVGLGKMGLSHLSIIRAHEGVEVVAVCDSSSYILGILGKYTGLQTFTDYDQMIAAGCDLDAVVIATPSRSHGALVRASLDRGLHVFCEKPFCLDANESQSLADLGERRNLVTQVGYHCRFVGAFREVKALLDANAIGEVTHVLGEAYGPVVLKPKGSTWRSQRAEGGGCLYDYAAHPLDLINWYLGEPIGVGGTVLNQVFSREIDDEVFGTMYYPQGRTAQISVNWSDESQRKMTTRMTVWGTAGRIFADRQECQVYLRDTATPPEGYEAGWNVRYTTELTEPVDFYVRGEEYSAQLRHFLDRIRDKSVDGQNSFRSAAATDRMIELLASDAAKGPATRSGSATVAQDTAPRPWRALAAAGREVAAAAAIRGTRLKQRIETARRQRSS